jgi:hypothetical protein
VQRVIFVKKSHRHLYCGVHARRGTWRRSNFLDQEKAALPQCRLVVDFVGVWTLLHMHPAVCRKHENSFDSTRGYTKNVGLDEETRLQGLCAAMHFTLSVKTAPCCIAVSLDHISVISVAPFTCFICNKCYCVLCVATRHVS